MIYKGLNNKKGELVDDEDPGVRKKARETLRKHGK